MGIYNSKNRVGKNSNRWIENKPKIVCKNCAKTFEVIPSQKTRRRFCSKKCEQVFKVGKNNPFYGKHHTPETKALMRTNNTTQTQEKNPLWIDRILKECEMCGIEYEVERRLVTISRFCSKQCKANYDSLYSKGRDNPNWKGGITKDRQGLYSSREWKNLTKKVFKRDNYKCQMCGVTGRQENKIHIHHVMSFKKVETRDDIDNLILLCQICHNWVHSNKNKNGDFIDE
jgi:5-methylcytosine-specific restriction endonuclease McrA